MSANTLGKRDPWKNVLKTAADPDRVRNFLEHVQEDLADQPALARLEKASDEEARILAALCSGSQVMSKRILTRPEWLEALTPEWLERARRPQGLRREIKAWLDPALQQEDYHGALTSLRQFKQKEMCRIAARDLARLANTVEIIQEISNVADVCLDVVLQVCRARLEKRFGKPYHQESGGVWVPTQFAILGLGKLGGQELNYSSDVDLMFVYAEEGMVCPSPPRKGTQPSSGLSNHQFFHRLVESLVSETIRATEEGMLYRIDLRLRPEGDGGPLVRSLPSCETFYAQWGQTWERMMLIKARCVAGDCDLGGEFLEMIHPFRFPRFLHDRALQEIAAMKARIENEVVKAGHMERNVKLGRGGIREIEFIAQTAQMIQGGRLPFLQGSQTLPALLKMVDYELMPRNEAKALTSAYCFFRDVEHRLQMDLDLQTHTIPSPEPDQHRLARLMGFRNSREFETKRRNHAGNVRRIYRKQLQIDETAEEPASKLPRDLDRNQAKWEDILQQHSFRDPAHSYKLLREFVLGPGYVHVSPRTSELAWELVEKFLDHCLTGESQTSTFNPGNDWISDPDRVLARLDRFVSAYGARSMLFETWAHHTTYYELLLRLFDRSEFLAERAIHTPDLVDDLVQSGRLNRRKTAEETLEDLRFGTKDKDQMLWLRRYHQAELMRIGLRDILGMAEFEQNLEELSNLADACLQYSLEITLRKRRLKSCPLAIIGLGKLGGRELNYGSDLDILFVADPKVQNLDGLEKVAADVMGLLSKRTEMGIVFETDARLRPDGEKGLLVNTLDRFEEYYRQRAQLWEIQALTRTRPVAGHPQLGNQFQRMVGGVANFHPDNVQRGFVSDELPASSPDTGLRTRKKTVRKAGSTQRSLAAYDPQWKSRIARMRQRIEKERTRPGKEALAIKTGSGGLVDAEFIAQTFCLEQGRHEANTAQALHRLGEAGWLPRDLADSLISNYEHLRHVEGVLRRWSLEGEGELPADAAAFQRVAIRCGFTSADQFRDRVKAWREHIRRVYVQVFDFPQPSRPKTAS